jgi:hypothetical protein
VAVFLVLAACANDPTGLGGTGLVVVPLRDGAGGERSEQEQARDAFYSSVLEQMSAAVRERDAAGLEMLLLRHDDARAPDWAAERFERFREALGGVRFLGDVAARASVALVDEDGSAPVVDGVLELDRLGVAQEVEIVVPAPSAGEVRLAKNTTAFRLTVVAIDHDLFGGRAERTAQEIVRLGRSITLGLDGEGELRIRHPLPELDVRGVWREQRIDVDLVPGTARVDGRKVPLQQTRCGSVVEHLFPPGTDAIRARPLATLREAVRRDDESVYRHALLATRFLGEDERDEAIADLVRWLRVARGTSVRVATTCLRELTGLDYPLDERDPWLAWWARTSGG